MNVLRGDWSVALIWGGLLCPHFNMGWSDRPHDRGDGARAPIKRFWLIYNYVIKRVLHGARHRIALHF